MREVLSKLYWAGTTQPNETGATKTNANISSLSELDCTIRRQASVKIRTTFVLMRGFIFLVCFRICCKFWRNK